MNIAKERVKNIAEIDDEYLCPICFHVLWKPIECQNCQRLFCKHCIDQCLKKKPDVCPLCQHYKEKRCSPIFYSLLCKFKIACENKNNGCEDILSYESLEKHQEQCQYQIQNCRGCQIKVLKRDLDQHEGSCGDMTVECKRCKLIYKQKEKHEQLDCLMAMVGESNKRIQSLENLVENLQTHVKALEATLDMHFLRGDLPSSVIHDIPLSSLIPSWKIIYNFPYNHKTTVEELRALESQCKNKIIVGAINGSASLKLEIAAMGPSEILSLNSPLNQPTIYGSVNWYLTPNKSFGFAPSSTTINCNSADHEEADNSENRLSWHLSQGGGWRAGAVKNLGDNNEWRKIIMTEK